MSSQYREDRRIDPIRKLSAVSKNEATEATDVNREKRLELERERLADELRQASKPRRSFADLLTKKP